MSVADSKQRKFTQGKQPVGAAKQTRDAVALAVRESSISPLGSGSRPHISEPLDYENFLVRNRTVLENDVCRDLVLFPRDDIAQSNQSRETRTTVSSVPANALMDAKTLFTRECLKSYVTDWHLVHYNYSQYGADASELFTDSSVSNELMDHVTYECDASEANDEEIKDAKYATGIVKEGYLYKGPDLVLGQDSTITFSKAFKRRYCYLQQEVDGSFRLDYYKDKGKSVKGSVCLDFCTNVSKTSKKSGRPIVVLFMSEGRSSCVLAAENDIEGEEWVTIIRGVLEKIATATRRAKMEETASTASQGSEYSSVKGDSLDRLRLPDVSKCSSETDHTIAIARQTNRHNLFSLYAEMQATSNPESSGKADVQPYHEHFGLRFTVECKALSFRLQLPAEHGEISTQVEPFFLRMALFDLRDSRKLSEDFCCDLNSAQMRAFLAESLTDTTSQSRRETTPELRGISEERLMKWSTKAVFSVNRPHEDVVLVIRLDKILQGSCSTAWEPYVKQDARYNQKFQKTVKSVASQLGQYRMPFAWGARSVFQQFVSGVDLVQEKIDMYKADPAKQSDEELVKLLLDMRKPEKASKFQVMPGYITLRFDIISVSSGSLESCITSSYLPLKPWRDDDIPVVREIQDFSAEGAGDAYPYSVHYNTLFVYPHHLKFDSQKTFAKARNIACRVEFRDCDDVNVQALNCIYGQSGVHLHSVFVDHVFTAVIHHDTSPQFYEEVKICLPSNLSDKHHVLFTFYHVSVESALSGKKRDADHAVGYAWLSLVKNNRLHFEECLLPIAATLPTGYLSNEQLGLGKGHAGPDIRWVEGGKPLFRVSLRLCSTVWTKDAHLQNFFLYCQRMRDTGAVGDIGCSDKMKTDPTKLSPGEGESQELVRLLKTLHAVDTVTLIHYLPTVLNQLLSLLPATDNEDILLNVIRTVVHVVHECNAANKRDALQAYVKFVFVGSVEGSRTVHEELAKTLTMVLRPGRADNLVTTKFLRHSWFFFDIMAKSMAQHLLTESLVMSPRTERFGSDLQYRIETLVQTLVAYMCQKYPECLDEVKLANAALANFLKACLSLMSRKFVFDLIYYYVDKFDSLLSKMAIELKLEFLKIICNHEHFVPLNVPLLCNKNGPIRKIPVVRYGSYADKYANAGGSSMTSFFQRLLHMGAGMFSSGGVAGMENGHTPAGAVGMVESMAEVTAADLAYELELSDEYCKHHFLTGLVLSQLRFMLQQHADSSRQRAIMLLRNLLAKASVDKRYASTAAQARIATLYFPLLSLVLDFMGLLAVDSSTSMQLTPNAEEGHHSWRRNTPKRNTFSGDSVLSAREQSFLAGMEPGRDSLPKNRQNGAPSVSREGSADRIVDDPQMSLGRKSELGEQLATLGGGSGSLKGGHSKSPSTATAATIVLAQTLPFAVFGGMNVSETKDLLISVLYVLKYAPEDVVFAWIKQRSEEELLKFLDLLSVCVQRFEYRGKQKLLKDASLQRQFNYAQRTAPGALNVGKYSVSRTSEKSLLRAGAASSPISVLAAGGEFDSPLFVLQDACLAQEVGLVVLDALSTFCTYFKDLFQVNRGESPLLQGVFGLYLSYLHVHTSVCVLQHVFAALRMFIKNFSVVLFKGKATYCSELCHELLKCCNSAVEAVRQDACVCFYLLMRANYETSGRRNFTRVHLQMVVALSQLMGDVLNLNCPLFHQSLSIINTLADNDRTMRNTQFVVEVKEVIRRLRTVLMATSQLLEHSDDPEMLCDLQHSLAASYSATPELRRTWLQSLAKLHAKHGNWSEAAYASLHIVALVAEYLKRRGVFKHGCDIFRSVSDNIEKDESAMKDDSGFHDVQFTDDTFVESVEECVQLIVNAERYELLGFVYRLILPIYEERKNYEALANAYKVLHDSYSKVIQVNRTHKRILGSYFRVGFYGQAYFGDRHEKEFIYKEPKVTSLAEVSERLQNLYGSKHGRDNIRLLSDSNAVSVEALDPRYGYIQITHVTPFFDATDLPKRQTEYEKNTNVQKFVFETPFTADGKAHGSVEEQCKRRTVLTTRQSFPYVVKRIEVFSKTSDEYSPLEVAITEMRTRAQELQQVTLLKPSDMKKLQLKLQGSVQVTVNAGPIAYANAFMTEPQVEKYGVEKLVELREAFRAFLTACMHGLELNSTLVTSEQFEYHQSLVHNFKAMTEKLRDIFGEELLPDMTDADRRGSSLSVFNAISGIAS